MMLIYLYELLIDEMQSEYKFEALRVNIIVDCENCPMNMNFILNVISWSRRIQEEISFMYTPLIKKIYFINGNFVLIYSNNFIICIDLINHINKILAKIIFFLIFY